MIRTLFFGVDGHARSEKMKADKRLIELRDGFHPLTSDAVFRDYRRKNTSLVVLWDGVAAPEGVVTSKTFLRSLYQEFIVTTLSLKNLSVSTMAGRAMERAIRWLLTRGFATGFMFIILIVIIRAVLFS